MGMTVLRKGGSTPVASDDRILFDKIFDSAGIITGGGATMSAVNKIHVPETTAWIKGTEIKIDEQDVTVGLSDSGTKYGRVKLVVDWSTEETAHFEYEIAASTSAFPELVQEDNINFSAGIWEEVFATYTCTEASISDVAYCMSPLQDASGGSLIAGSESGTLSTQPYVTGQYIIWNGKLKKVTAPIAIGDTLAVGTNLSADTTVGNELYALNSSLTASDNLKFRFATDGEGNYGYLDGDDAFVPFSNIEFGFCGALSTTRFFCLNTDGTFNATLGQWKDWDCVSSSSSVGYYEDLIIAKAGYYSWAGYYIINPFAFVYKNVGDTLRISPNGSGDGGMVVYTSKDLSQAQ